MLPSYCGDGVANPDELDCYVPVELPFPDDVYGDPIMVDLDGDGTQDFVFTHNGGMQYCTPARYDGVAFELGDTVRCSPKTALTLIADWDNDGDDDIITPYSSSAYTAGVIAGTGPLSMGTAESIDLLGSEFTEESAIPYQFGGDGPPGFLVVVTGGDGHPGDLRQYRQEDGSWNYDVVDVDLPGCGTPTHALREDLNSDGLLDLVLFEGGAPCDPYPRQYDPTWHQLTVLHAVAETGLFEVAQQLPAGGKPLGRGTLYDYDGDSFLDLFLRVDVISPLTPLIVRGTAGGFSATSSPAPSAFSAFFGPVRHANLDADPQPELMTSDPEGQSYVVQLGERGSTQASLFDPFAGGFGDVNGDGIDDYIRVNVDDKFPGDYVLMVSAP